MQPGRFIVESPRIIWGVNTSRKRLQVAFVDAIALVDFSAHELDGHIDGAVVVQGPRQFAPIETAALSALVQVTVHERAETRVALLMSILLTDPQDGKTCGLRPLDFETPTRASPGSTDQPYRRNPGVTSLRFGNATATARPRVHH